MHATNILKSSKKSIKTVISVTFMRVISPSMVTSVYITIPRTGARFDLLEFFSTISIEACEELSLALCHNELCSELRLSRDLRRKHGIIDIDSIRCMMRKHDYFCKNRAITFLIPAHNHVPNFEIRHFLLSFYAIFALDVSYRA